MKNRVRQLLLWIVPVLLMSAAVVTWFFLQPGSNIPGRNPVGIYSPGALFNEFAGDPSRASLKLSNRVILVTGTVSEKGDGCILMGQSYSVVRCAFKKELFKKTVLPSAGDSVTIKGLCRGLDFAEVLVTHCILINKTSK